ncbi:hypothetical protein FJ987_20840 [Mesorhizobium sp. CU2]|uniref:hypothetical protein n=1 Tax=unclassified Mesorhizobium TaxID=325217 RepID=UPI00112A6585|nr:MULTISPECIES: hypothetical protein [unclassified Mesorhizobium]TPN76085.1 hypothetical protein FJ988_28020 [Mesorhizobium sp. CU3]TPO10460.1 hypothetical protein FJ987_20840 [Mesorhizobium sp. CU2]
MIAKYCGKSIASILSGLLILSTPTAEAAGSLAGSKGDVHYPVYFPPGTKGNCGKAYNAYIAAGGHSAYASTPIARMTEFFICGVSLNTKSQQAAEDLAMRNCLGGLKRYKFQTSGACSIAASK